MSLDSSRCRNGLAPVPDGGRARPGRVELFLLSPLPSPHAILAIEIGLGRQLRQGRFVPTFPAEMRGGGTAMLSRRALVMTGGSFALAANPAQAAAVMTDDGYYREDWFLDSFLELADDLKSTAAAGKQLAIIWEQRGCPYCLATHQVNFAQKNVETYIRSHFEVLELNFHGSRVVTDFDGEQLGERQLAIKYGVRGTPIIQFFADKDGLASKAPREREVNRIQGYMPPREFLLMFAFVGERAYERGS